MKGLPDTSQVYETNALYPTIQATGLSVIYLIR
jgi:hypothetical protein